MSSLAIDEMEDMGDAAEIAKRIPELYVVKWPNEPRNHSFSSIPSLEEVVCIEGRFTVSF